MSFDNTTVPGKPTIVHDPDATLDYGWDLASLIQSDDAISTVLFKTVDGASATLATITNNVVYAWLTIVDKAALTGKTIGVTCEFVTVNGRTDDRTLYFKIKDR